MPNPALLLCDTDALVQFFLAGDLRPLQELARRFGIQPTIVLEVDLELRWVGKYRDHFVPQLEKSLKHGTLVKLDQSRFQTYLASASPGTSWSTYQTLGARYEGIVERGEAYTHAAAVVLGMPALSNDQRAVHTLRGQMCAVGIPVLRSFDLFMFAYESGILGIKACEDVRDELLRRGEGVPGPFRHASFEDGAKNFPCRLRQGSASSAPYDPPTNHYETLTVIPL